MVIRIAGYGYQRGFGGHFHNDDAVGVLRDIPGLVDRVACARRTTRPRCSSRAPSRRTVDGSVCVFLEPIALYHARDLHEDGDDGWVAALVRRARPGRVGAHVPRRRRPHDRDVGERPAPVAPRRAPARGGRDPRARARPALARAASRRGSPARGERDGKRPRRRRDAPDGRRLGRRRRRARRRRASTDAWRAWRARTRSSRSATRRGSCSSPRTRSRRLRAR